jgi:hypothetical protein
MMTPLQKMPFPSRAVRVDAERRCGRRADCKYVERDRANAIRLRALLGEHKASMHVADGRCSGAAAKAEKPAAAKELAVTLRQLPGAAVLGLVAALVTHVLLFGREHAWGGSYHDALLDLTLAATAALASATGALLWSGARCAADGTVLAARIRELLPGWGVVAAFGAAWFAFGERIEPAHDGVPVLAIVVVLAVTAWLIVRFATAALRLLADFVFAIAIAIAALCHPEPLDGMGLRTPAAPRQAQRDTVWCRRFSRPPPVAANA